MSENIETKQKKSFPFLEMFMLLLLIGGLLCIYLGNGLTEKDVVSYNEFIVMAENHEIKEITIDYNSDTFTFQTTTSDKTFITDNPRYDDFKKDMLSYDIKVSEVESSGVWNEIKSSVISSVIVIAFIFFIFIWFILPIFRSVSKRFNSDDIGTHSNDVDVSFSDVAGLHEVKQDLMGVVDMLKNPEKYEEAGARISKGILLYGPPGTGKTLLARAIAGEAGVNFLSVSGADFSNKYVGVAADRVRSLFNKAKDLAPCIIFIDEIDAVGGDRDHTHDERVNTMDALLTCMDGFDECDGILVIAATNRFEALDPAFIRPGRFDNKFAVPLPSTNEERMEVIEIYKNNKTFADDVNFELFAKQFIGSSPADIEVVMNEAAIFAARRDGIITNEDLDAAYLKKILKGHVKNEDKDAEAKRLVAYHEAGHALIGVLTGQEVTKVAVQSTTSGAGGFTLTAPTKMGLFTKKELEANVLQLYGGRAAEELVFGEENITTGASNDITVATSTLYHIVAKLGMSKKGTALIDYDVLNGGEKIIIDKVCELSTEFYQRTLKMLEDNKSKLDDLANALIEKESLCESEILDIVKG